MDREHRPSSITACLKTRPRTWRAPFTLWILAAYIVCAIISNTVFHPLSNVWLERLGFALTDLSPRRGWRLPVSVLLTPGAFYFWFNLIALGIAVGACEWWAGVRRTALAFWSVHLGTGIIEAIVGLAASRLVNSALLEELVKLRSVGPSAGYLACLGVALTYFSRRFQVYVAGVVGAVLAGTVVWAAFHARTDPEGLIDAATHIMALPLGWWLGARWQRSRSGRRSRLETPRPSGA
jgi:membrane associated rhomboid family serine protease